MMNKNTKNTPSPIKTNTAKRSPRSSLTKSENPKSPTTPKTNSGSQKSSQKSSPRTPTNAATKLANSPNTKKIAELRAARKAAIDRLDFVTAEKIENEINELLSGKKSEDLSMIKSDLETFLKDSIEYYKQKLIQLDESKEQDIYNFRKQINQRFEALKSKHMDEMIELERLYSNDRLKESQRVSPEFDHIAEKAKSAGILHDYKTAMELQEEAYLAAQASLDRRLAQVDQEYENKNQILMSKQKTELLQLIKRLQTGLEKINEKDSQTRSSEKNSLDTKIASEFQRHMKKLHQRLRQSEIAEPKTEIENFINKILEENNLDCPKLFITSPSTENSPRNLKPNSPK